MEKTAAGCSLGAQTWDAVWMVFLWVMMKFHSHVSRSITASRDKKESSRSPVYFVPSRKLGFNHAVIKFLYGRLSFTQQHFQAACTSMLSPAPCMRPRRLLLQLPALPCSQPALLGRFAAVTPFFPHHNRGCESSSLCPGPGLADSLARASRSVLAARPWECSQQSSPIASLKNSS